MRRANDKMIGGCFLIIVIFYLLSLIGTGIAFLFGVILTMLPYFVLILGVWMIYEYLYFESSAFINIKKSIETHTKNCNELNEHIEDLKNTFISFKQIDYGQSTYVDMSQYSFKRPELKKLREAENTYKCSLSVLNNVSSQPFKYVCKYFNIEQNEESLEAFEKVLNNFSAVEQGKKLLIQERESVLKSIDHDIPFLIKRFRHTKLMKELGFETVDLKQSYFPKYVFQYISPGGNSAQSHHIIFNIETLNRFVDFLGSLVKFRKSIAGQRALMTSDLREKIKKRDNFCCKMCGNSTKKEPNLLLEIDHIVPLSKNGLTNEINLQTLCWRCNRSKGSKILMDI